MMLRAIILLLAWGLAILAQSGPPARPRPPVAWWENPVANGLTLSESQKDRINKIIREHRDRLTTERMEVERAERDLESVFDAEAVDFQRGKVVTDQLLKARGELTHEMVRMTLRLRAVLTPDQWRTLQDRNVSAVGQGAKGGRGRPKGAKGAPSTQVSESH
jgi:Spy/CpxP family protein refolding chaperone